MLTIVAWRERSRPLARVTFGDPDDELGRGEVPCETREDVMAAVLSWLDRIDWGRRPGQHLNRRT